VQTARIGKNLYKDEIKYNPRLLQNEFKGYTAVEKYTSMFSVY